MNTAYPLNSAIECRRQAHLSSYARARQHIHPVRAVSRCHGGLFGRSGLIGMWPKRLSMFSCRMCATVLLLCSAFALRADPQAGQALKVSQTPDNGVLHVQARQAPLSQLLAGIAKIAGLGLHYLSLPAERLIDGDCQAVLLAEVLTCLLGSPQNVVVRYSPQGRPAEAWLLSSEFNGNGAEGVQLVMPLAGNIGFAEETSAFDILSYSNDNDKRAKAVWELGMGDFTENPERAKKLLTEALSDPEPGIRSRALTSLSKMDGGVAEPLLYQMLNDDSPSVRLSAVAAGIQNTAFLMQAQQNNIPEVGDSATAILNKLNNTIAEP